MFLTQQQACCAVIERLEFHPDALVEPILPTPLLLLRERRIGGRSRIARRRRSCGSWRCRGIGWAEAKSRLHRCRSGRCSRSRSWHRGRRGIWHSRGGRYGRARGYGRSLRSSRLLGRRLCHRRKRAKGDHVIRTSGRNDETLLDKIRIDLCDQTVATLAVGQHRSSPSVTTDHLPRRNLFSEQRVVHHIRPCELGGGCCGRRNATSDDEGNHGHGIRAGPRRCQRSIAIIFAQIPILQDIAWDR